MEPYDITGCFALNNSLAPFLDELEKELLVFSPYFVPGEKGADFLCGLAERGCRVRIITNSLASTDMALVHAGYAKYRHRLLRAGVELYELERTMSRHDRIRQLNTPRIKKASLHAKSFVIDRDQVFVGSLNFDPRSLVENTEIGILLDSKEIAAEMADHFDYAAGNMSFRLEQGVDDEGLEYILWHGYEGGEEKVWSVDPHSNSLTRLVIRLMGYLPIESQL